VAALVLNTHFKDAIHAIEFVWKNAAVMGIAFWIGLVWRRFNSAGAWAATLSGYALIWILTHPPGWLAEYAGFLFRDPNAAAPIVRLPMQMLVYLSLSALVGIIACLITRRPSKERLDDFYLLLRTPVRPGEKVLIPCTLPEDPLPPETGKLIPHPDIELPMPTKVGMIGFFTAWVLVFGIIYLTKWLAGLGG